MENVHPAEFVQGALDAEIRIPIGAVVPNPSLLAGGALSPGPAPVEEAPPLSPAEAVVRAVAEVRRLIAEIDEAQADLRKTTADCETATHEVQAGGAAARRARALVPVLIREQLAIGGPDARAATEAARKDLVAAVEAETSSIEVEREARRLQGADEDRIRALEPLLVKARRALAVARLRATRTEDDAHLLASLIRTQARNLLRFNAAAETQAMIAESLGHKAGGPDGILAAAKQLIVQLKEIDNDDR